ncbi:MAG TPA: glucose-6-phosphate isomerase, partial [Casimicrobiaceae bacterium]|nr:glucose-6-phosphate isomerase [Casimicrobiaceae bacterium]
MDDTLAGHARRLADADLRRLFATQPDRAQRLALEWGDWRIDFSKERLDGAALDTLVAHARSAEVPRWIAALFAGERINLSEQRAALH